MVVEQRKLTNLDSSADLISEGLSASISHYYCDLVEWEVLGDRYKSLKS
jgi:hypothetical protein